MFKNTVPALAAMLLILQSGCGGVTYMDAVRSSDMSVSDANAAHVATLLLAAGEDEDIDDIDAATVEETVIGDVPGDEEPIAKERPPREPGEGGIGLKIGLGLALPGSGSIGSASGSSLPAYSDVLSTGSALEIIGEFGGGKYYAQFVSAQYGGTKWTNPGDASDSYLLSETSMTYIGGGAKFGGMFYGKVGAGLMMWPDISRIDAFSGFSEPVLIATTAFAFTFGGGAQFKLGPLTAYADAEFTMIPAPEKAENAVIFWPNFEAEGMNAITLKTGVGMTF